MIYSEYSDNNIPNILFRELNLMIYKPADIRYNRTVKRRYSV